MKNSSFEQIEKIIKKAKRILVATHQGPDGDAIGSLLAFGMYLKKIETPHYLLCVSGVPHSLEFLPGSKLIKSKHPKINFDLIIALDCGQKNRVGLDDYFKKYSKTPILVFDHHPISGQGGNFGIVKPEASSVCELLFGYFKSIKFKIDKKIAFCLAIGILSDTGFFKYIADAKSLKIMVELMEKFKIRPVEIDDAMNGTVKLAALKMTGKISSRTEHHFRGDFIYSWLKRRELTKHHLTIDDVRGIIERLKNVESGRFSLLLIEEGKGRIRGELRGRPDKNYNVSKLATKLGGGGHKFASGFRFKGTIDAALKLVSKYASKK